MIVFKSIQKVTLYERDKDQEVHHFKLTKPDGTIEILTEKDFSFLKKRWTYERNQRERAQEKQERANEAGMLHGIGAYNEEMGNV